MVSNKQDDEGVQSDAGLKLAVNMPSKLAVDNPSKLAVDLPTEQDSTRAPDLVNGNGVHEEIDRMDHSDLPTAENAADSGIESKANHLPDVATVAVSLDTGDQDQDQKQLLDQSATDKVNKLQLKCTGCGQQIIQFTPGAFGPHPGLDVLLCRNCKGYLEEGGWTVDREGCDEECHWCGDGGNLLLCDECPHAFCRQCVRRNLSRSSVSDILDTAHWRCFLCDPAPLASLQAVCYAACWLLESTKESKRKSLAPPGPNSSPAKSGKKSSSSEKKRKRSLSQTTTGTTGAETDTEKDPTNLTPSKAKKAKTESPKKSLKLPKDKSEGSTVKKSKSAGAGEKSETSTVATAPPTTSSSHGVSSSVKLAKDEPHADLLDMLGELENCAAGLMRFLRNSRSRIEHQCAAAPQSKIKAAKSSSPSKSTESELPSQPTPLHPTSSASLELVGRLEPVLDDVRAAVEEAIKRQQLCLARLDHGVMVKLDSGSTKANSAGGEVNGVIAPTPAASDDGNSIVLVELDQS